MKILRAELLQSAGSARQFPTDGLPEVAFLGRSNVGKSSILNALVGRKQLARTSSTPGKTRLIHFFHVLAGGTELALVDLPGYGWAKVSKKERQSWGKLVEGYLEDRPSLRLAILLQDLRRDFSEDETLLLDWLDERDVAWQVVITKADKLKPMRRAKRLKELALQLERKGTKLVATSAQSRQGVDDLWQVIQRSLAPDG
ncbi:MAG: ribosome biogenesis GTP-binding protein YihA/YsxC [Myxococcota bacterium]|nr:ribosome biogenesis GTP-binding protein YihA/YsxC [Myxococcota bacterium]